MGSRLRHYRALMKKNWIIWKRTLAVSLCELFCPIALMAVLAIARALISFENVDPKSNIQSSTFFYPIDYLSNPNLTMANAQANMAYSSFLKFHETEFAYKDVALNFLPTSCTYYDDFDKERPIIAYAGNKNVTSEMVKNLQNLQRAQQQTARFLLQKSDMIDNNPNATKADKDMATQLRKQGNRVKSVLINYQYKEFDNHQDILDYISGKDYMKDDDNPGVCFGFSIYENDAYDYDARIIVNSNQREPKAQGIPPQLNPAYTIFDRDQDAQSFKLYNFQGYSFIQNWIANEVLQLKTNQPNASIAMTLVPFKSDKYVSDSFGRLLNEMLSFFMLLMYILPVYRLISNIVAEKESKARESMKMMGLSDFSYWLSWFSYYLIVVSIITGICVIILSPTVFVNSDKSVIFLYFWIYGISLFGLCILIQSFFSRARVAAITGTLIYFGSSFVQTPMRDPQVSQGSKNAASLLPTVAVGLGAANLGLFETNGMGVTYDTIFEVYQNYRFVDCLILMSISFVIMFWLGIYFDNVLPSAYGLRKPWYFCFQASYWMGKNSSSKSSKIKLQLRKNSEEDMEKSNKRDYEYFEAKQMKKENFEPPSRDMIQLEHDSKILKIKNLKKVFENGFQAVKGVNIKMYNGQIFALLGHNGAGKTTTISMLTGLLSASDGQAEVFGYDLFNEMDSVRQFLGVCPQHDILFDLLTPEEHLDIFCDFKGVDSKTKKEEIRKMLIDVDILGGKDIEAKKLSGGNRRKLSVAIALIGGSRLVLLDEPTSGMDLSARRKLWNMLKNYKNNRIIILTTHYMDEADILGDRIGIMTGGQLICLGSSLFLKKRFGVGYNLTMVKKDNDPNSKVGKYLKDKIGEVKKLSEVSSEITYQIPTALSHKFKDFFVNFDEDLDQLDIRSYGISVTTLEEVFLRVGHGDDSNDDKKIKEELENKKPKKDKYDDYSIAENSEQGACNVFWIHFNALLIKRLQLYKKNYKGLIIEILIPVLLVLIGFGFSKIQFFTNSPDRILQPSEYPLKQRILANSKLQRPSGYDADPQQLIQSLPDYENSFEVKYVDYSQINDNTSEKGESVWLQNFDDDVFQARMEKPYSPSRYTSYYIYEADKYKMNFKVSTFVNITSQDVSAFYPEFMYEAILKQATGNPNFRYQVRTVSFPITQKLRDRAAQANGIFIVFVVSIGFALIPASVISFILNEREKNLKHMQLISGLSLPAYWITNLFFDIFKAIIPSAIVIGLMYAFELEYDYVYILFLLYPVGVIPFTYVTSFIFQSENIAQTVTIFSHFVIAGLGAIVAWILRLISSTYSAGDALVWVFRFLIPSYCLTDSIMYQATKASLYQLRPSTKEEDLSLQAIGGDILLICMHCAFYSILLILIESRAFHCLSSCLCCLSGKRVRPRRDILLDEDVIQEEDRVAKTSSDQMKVRVNKFRKTYGSGSGCGGKPIVAVERTSFGLDYGECFALLGVNGAGKTTIFKSLTGGISPTSGEVTICGMNIVRDFDKIRKLIGYCPQQDAIFDLMTVEEHLYYYARIKGIQQRKIRGIVEKHIKEMNLEDHRFKQAGSLSGGNKRKLSVAMCVIGNPPIILLDEPSAGMDPEARRFMWSIVAKISQQRQKSAVILTTHSMEEAEALSTKMGIMVKGGIFKCFGSSQHIKSKYGTGYEIEAKIRKIAPEELGIMIENYGFGSQEEVDFDDLPNIMQGKMIDEFLIKELRQGGMGNDLYQEAEEHDGQVSVKNFVNWLHIQLCGMKIVEGLLEEFGKVDILEHYNDYYKMRVPRGDRSIGFVFSLIESQKDIFQISEYSASQTTLEQIFQTFANLQIDQESNLKFVKKDFNPKKSPQKIKQNSNQKQKAKSSSSNKGSPDSQGPNKKIIYDF